MTLTIYVPFLLMLQLLTDLLVTSPTSFLVCQDILGTFLHSQLSSTMETHIITTSNSDEITSHFHTFFSVLFFFCFFVFLLFFFCVYV